MANDGANHGNVRPIESGKRYRVRHEVYAVSDLNALLIDIRTYHKTGSVTINYSNGTPSGTVEWKQKEKEE